MKRSVAGAVGVVALVSAFSMPAHATVYDAFADFSVPGSNPNGAWTYAYGSVGSATQMEVSGTGPSNGNSPFPANIEYWQAANPVSLVPVIGKSTDGQPLSFLTVTVPGNMLLVHPGIDSDVIVQWTAPTAGKYSFSGFYSLQDSSPSGVIGSVFKNDVSLYTGPLAGALGFGASEKFSGIETLAAGDKLSFVVNNGGLYYNDSTGFDVTISSVPEPTTWAMMILGFVGIGFMTYRRKATPALMAV
jgi:hypothetical protein